VRERDAILSGEGVPQSALVQLLPLFNQYSKLRAVAAAELQKNQELSRKYQAEDEKQKSLTRKTVMNSAVTALQAENHFLLKQSKVNEKWYPSILDGAEKILSGAVEPEEAAKAAIKAQLADHYMGLYIAETAKLREVIAALEKKAGVKASRTPKPGSSPAPIRSKSLEKKGMTIDDLADQTVFGS
jgi:hypothetical protein